MSNFMHLTFEERCRIEELLNKRYRKYQIAKEIGKTPSTISREINSHKDFRMHTDYSVVYILKIVKIVIIAANISNL